MCRGLKKIHGRRIHPTCQSSICNKFDRSQRQTLYSLVIIADIYHVSSVENKTKRVLSRAPSNGFNMRLGPIAL